MVDLSRGLSSEQPAPKLTLSAAVLGLVATAFGGICGALWSGGSTMATITTQITNQEHEIQALREEYPRSIAVLRQSIVERMDREVSERERRRAAIDTRLETDERETKAAAQFVGTVDLRLTRMEAQLDLVVKNVTAAGVLHR